MDKPKTAGAGAGTAARWGVDDPGGGPGAPAERRSTPVPPDILPYVMPMFAYVALSGLESYLPQVDKQPSPHWYPLAYAAKVVIVALLAWRYRSTWRDLRPFPSAGSLALATLSGLLVTGIWVGLDGLYPSIPFLSQRSAFDPSLLSPGLRWGFIVVRMLGLVALVPLIEELFWRSFLIRWLIDQDFPRVPIGRVTPLAAGLTSVLFALAHPEWLPALLTGLLWAWLLWQTKSLGACVLSHAVANLILGIYVISSGDWKYW
jgi:CAAX prenyl protease-like protein